MQQNPIDYSGVKARSRTRFPWAGTASLALFIAQLIVLIMARQPRVPRVPVAIAFSIVVALPVGTLLCGILSILQWRSLETKRPAPLILGLFGVLLGGLSLLVLCLLVGSASRMPAQS